MGEERKCISCVRKCIVNNLLIIYFVWFFGLLEVGWGYSFFFFLLWGSIYNKKWFIYFSVRYFEVFFGSCFDFFDCYY